MAEIEVGLVTWEPSGAAADVTRFFGGFTLEGEWEESEIFTLADFFKQFEKTNPQAKVSVVIYEDAENTFRRGFWLAGFQSKGTVTLGFRERNSPVSAANPEYRVAVLVSKDTVGGTRGEQKKYDFQLSTNTVIYSADGAAWLNYFTGQAAAVI